jgi:threonine dehydrogenase-like Zn-dependent dehydrogenase
MKALVWHGGDRLELEELPEPELRGDQVVLDVGLTGICGSDLHPYRGHAGPRVPPLVLGHEAVGRVDGREGRFVLNPLVACGECRSCRRGEPQLCEQRGLVGMDRQGVFAERVAVDPSALVPVPDGVPDEAAVLTEPLATAISALRLEGVDSGSTLAVIGGGPIGLLTVYVATEAGMKVVAAEPVEHRRELAGRLGAAETVLDPGELEKGSADAVVDAVGIEATWRAGIDIVRPGGSVCIVGLGQADGAMPVADLVRRGITVRGHFAYSPEDFEAALALLASSPPPLDGWVSVVPFDEGAEGFRRLVEEPERYTKVLVSIGGVA